MSESVTVTFVGDRVLPTSRDGVDYELSYSFVPTRLVGHPDEAAQTETGSVAVGISGTLAAMWGLQGQQIRNVFYEYAKRHVRAKAEEAALGGKSVIQLTSATAPRACPFDPAKVRPEFNRSVEVQVPSRSPVVSAEPSAIASHIIDLRDSINAIFGERFKDRLLTLAQERQIVELFKRTEDHEGYVCRVASISSLAAGIYPDPIRQYLAANATKKSLSNAKPIDLLGSFLRCSRSTKADSIMEAIKHFNRLRQMYPIHTDRAPGVLSAYRFFGIDYPVRDYIEAGEKLLARYRDMLEDLLDLLKNASF